MPRYKDIRLQVLDVDGYYTEEREFETVKAAKDWVKKFGLSADYWQRAAELETFHLQNVKTIRLIADGECIADWFPKWAA